MAKKVQRMGNHPNVKRAESKDQRGSASAAAVPRTKKDTLATPAEPPSKYRRRQIKKSWLPTHLYHAKRAHMTPPKEPLWRYAIPLTPTDKCYRTTHRASSSRGCVVWDTSYMNTIGAEGVDASLVGLLRGLGVEEVMLGGKAGCKWRAGSRGWEGWIQERDGEQRKMARVTIIWDVAAVGRAEGAEGHSEGKRKTRKMFVRVHPSVFLQVWSEILRVAKIQRPPVMVEDLRFEIGSVEAMGPGATEALISALRPIAQDKPPGDGSEVQSRTTPEEIWPCLCKVTNPASLPPNALLGFEISDPRLYHPPRTVKSAATSEALLPILASWPPDATQTDFAIFDRNARHTACRLLSSQKSINRRKGAALPGAYPDPLPEDPRIPILLAASRAPSQGGQGAWVVLLPWKTVLPVWTALVHYPLATGGNPRLGCLQEQRQVAFEQGTPWFPGDFPGTKSGWEWEMKEREKRKAKWEKRPKGKRVSWESIDLGDGAKGEIGQGWACDWERLFQGPSSADPIDPASVTNSAAPLTNSTVPHAHTPPPLAPPKPSLEHLPSPPLSIHHVPSPISPSSVAPTALTTISISLISRGKFTACARIYRLPTANLTLRDAWIAQSKVTKATKANQKHPPPMDFRPSQTALAAETPSHIRTQQLAAELLAPLPPASSSTQHPGASATTYPHVPGEEDLIGFVTTGNFNLGHGRGRAIGCVALARVDIDAQGVVESQVDGSGDDQVEGETQKVERRDVYARLCIVRDAGQSMGRLARWDFV